MERGATMSKMVRAWSGQETRKKGWSTTKCTFIAKNLHLEVCFKNKCVEREESLKKSKKVLSLLEVHFYTI